MKVELTIDFLNELTDQVDFISQDKPGAAQKFKDDLFKILNDLSIMPLKHKKSIYFKNELIRDLIFKGYTITYEIDKVKNQILAFSFLKYKEKP